MRGSVVLATLLTSIGNAYAITLPPPAPPMTRGEDGIEIPSALLALALRQPAVTVAAAVDPGANRHPISPLIYGVNFGDSATLPVTALDFADVPVNHPFYDFVMRTADDGISASCGGGATASLTRTPADRYRCFS